MKRTLLALLLIVLLSGCVDIGLRDVTDFNNDEIAFSNIVVTNEEDGTLTHSSMATSSPTIYTYVTITNAKDSTITADWYYEDDELIDTLAVSITQNEQRFVVSITSASGGWPEGTYTIDLYKDNEYIDSISYEIEDENPLSNPSYLVGEYSYHHADGDVPVNIIQHTLTLNSDGTWTEHYLWASLVINSTSEGSDNGTWSYANGELYLFTERNYNRTLYVEGNALKSVELLWNDVTLYFTKPWID